MQAQIIVCHGKELSRLMRKQTICIGEHKGADQLRSNCEADQRLCFRYSDSTIPLLLIPKFQASSSFLCLYRSVCVGLVRKPHCWFSHKAAQLVHTLITGNPICLVHVVMTASTGFPLAVFKASHRSSVKALLYLNLVRYAFMPFLKS